MTRLWERLFDISEFYVSGIPFPFERYEFDRKICFRRSGEQGCKACVAVEAERPFQETSSEQTITEIATIYALVSNFSLNIEPLGAHSLGSLEELGTCERPHGILRGMVVYPEEKSREYSARLSANWKRTRDVWKNFAEISHDIYPLRLALFYFYRGGLRSKVGHREGLDEAFIDTVTALEALFNDGAPDIKYKLAIRGAMILSFLKEPVDKNAFNLLKDAYDRRSDIIHGRGRKMVQSDDYRKIRQITRNCLKAYFALGLRKTKEDIIRSIDQALLEPEQRRILDKAIQEGLSELGL